MGIPLNIQCYAPGANGVPSTAYPLPDLRDKVDSYQHSISDRYGFESCIVSMRTSLAEATDWLSNGLMRSLIVYGPDAEIVWEGFLETVTVTVGQKKASLSLKNMANVVRYLWTDEYGKPGDTTYTPTPGSAADIAQIQSQSMFGQKLYLGSLPKVTPAMVASASAKALNVLVFPRSAEPTDAFTGDLGEITLELSFAGWYATFEWYIVSNSSHTIANTDVQLKTIYLPGYAATNAFFSTDYSGITITGAASTEYVAHFSTYKQVIDRLLSLGTASNNPIAYGVYEGRAFQAVTSAMATPSTITYQEDAGTGVVLDTYGNVVKPWNVRPNAMSQILQLLDSGPVAGAIDRAAVKYIARTTCAIQSDNIGCTLEPANVGGLDALMSAFGPIHNYNP